MFSKRNARAACVAAFAAALFVLVGPWPSQTAVEATPYHAVNSGATCNGCHVEPVGWHNPENRSDRRCALDCQACHVVPSGGGMRTPYGVYYQREVLPTWGRRPSAAGDPTERAREGEPTEGQYRLFGGFSGWWGGDTNHRTIDDRLGDIDASPTWQIGGDYRTMTIVPTDERGRDAAFFPMQLQTYVAAHPLSNVTAYLDVGIQGRQSGFDDTNFLTDILWLREMFVMVHDLPMAGYVRAGRFAPAYGWRLPDHTAYTRVGAFDQFRHGYGVEVGVAPNEWWGNLGAYYQGVDGWPGERTLTPGVGVTGQGGFKGLGLQLGVSGHAFAGEDGYGEAMFGPMWGVNLAPISYLGELGYRRTGTGGVDSRTSFVALHEVRAHNLVQGLALRGRYEWLDDDITLRDDHRHRVGVGVEWTPIAYVQMAVDWRRELYPSGALPKSELMLQLHGLF